MVAKPAVAGPGTDGSVAISQSRVEHIGDHWDGIFARHDGGAGRRAQATSGTIQDWLKATARPTPDTMTSRSSSTRTCRNGQIPTRLPLLKEPMHVDTVTVETEPGRWTVGQVGTRSEGFRRLELGPAALAGLTVLDSTFRYDGDGALLRLGLQRRATESTGLKGKYTHKESQ